jgi:hypothetical protein
MSMNGRESIITRHVLSNKDSKKEIMDKIQKGESIIGTEVDFNGKKYVITNGNIEKITNAVEELKKEIKMNTLISITMNLLENSTDIESEFVDIVNDNFWDLI